MVLATVTNTPALLPKNQAVRPYLRKGTYFRDRRRGSCRRRLLKFKKSLCNKKSVLFSLILQMIFQIRMKQFAEEKISVLVDANMSNSIPVFGQVKKSLSSQKPGVLITMVTRFQKNVLINRYWIQ